MDAIEEDVWARGPFAYFEDNVIFVQAVTMVLLVVVLINVLNPLTKGMIYVSFFSVAVMFTKTLTLKVMGAAKGMLYRLTLFWECFMRAFGAFKRVFYLGVSLELMLYFALIFMALVLLLWELFRYMRSRRVTYYVPIHKETDCYVGEKAMPNSFFEHVKVMPPFQAMVMASLDGKSYHVMGQCFWVDEGLITAAHVIEGFDYLCIYRDDDHKINIESKVFEIGHGDYAVCRDPLLITQKVGLAKAKLAKVAVEKDAGLSVNITAMEKRTIGFLDRHPQFGYVQYTGSTSKGFSGAPYYFGRTIFGMHLGADVRNIGYDAAFLKSELRPSRTIKGQLGIRSESSIKWLEEQMEMYEDVEYTRSPYNPDEYRVRIGGMYHIVDDSTLAKVLRRGARKANANIEYLEESAPKPKVTKASLNKVDAPKAEKQKEIPKVDMVKEAVKTTGEITQSTKSAELSKVSDPVMAMTQGIVGEFGRSSIYVGESRDVDVLPLAPRNAMTFNDSGNLLRAPAVTAGAPGMAYRPEYAQSQGQPIYGPMAYTYPPPLANCHMESQTLTHAQRNEASARTVRNRNRRLNRQRNKSELEQYRQLYGPMQRGGATSPQQPTQINGSTVNSTEH